MAYQRKMEHVTHVTPFFKKIYINFFVKKKVELRVLRVVVLLYLWSKFVLHVK